MKFELESDSDQVVKLDLGKEIDGAVLLKANGIEFLRITTDGEAYTINLSPESITTLKGLGFKTKDGKVKVI